MTDTPNSWRYSIRIPSWSQAQVGSSGEPTVFYQLEVTVLAPHGGPPKVRSLARRFSNFLSLFSRLKEELSTTSSTTTTIDLPPPPPKRSFTNVNKNPVLIEQRRRDLESWMWRLIQRPDVANSIMMAHFCELDAASRIITTTTTNSKSNEDDSTNIIATSNDNEDDEYELSSRSNVARMFSTTASQASTSSYHSDDHHHHHGQSPIRTGQSPPYSIITSSSSSIAGSSKKKAQQQQQQHNNNSSSSIENRVRPAFHIQKRAEIQQLVADLSKKLHIATTDLHDAVRTIHGNEEAMKVLAAQVDELIREREKEEEERKNDEEEKAISPTTTTTNKEEDESTMIIQRLKQQVAGLESQVELRTTDLHDKEVEMEGLMREVKTGNEMATALRTELTKVTELLEVERKERREDGERSRGEHKVLAREIKMLRLKVVEMEKEKEERLGGGGINDDGDAPVVGDTSTTNGGPVSLI